MLDIEFESIIFKEGNTYVSHSPKLDVSSCGNTVAEARNNLKIAVRLFLEEAERMGTLEEILSEAGMNIFPSSKQIPKVRPKTEVTAGRHEGLRLNNGTGFTIHLLYRRAPKVFQICE